MLGSFRLTLLLATLLTFALLQHSYCKPIPENVQNDNKKTDNFAQEAADALDSTLWFFKDSISNFIKDSSRINKIVSNMTDKIIKLPPIEKQQQYSWDESKRLQIEELKRLANKTLLETPSKLE